ncbi:hypothetical protein [Halomarina rubra]|uniref:Uncharacterized protein n=1 Tax=Halomarina rubra TaxID=2071873 RepID=A0ABD6B0W7_9EURY|nr:hypothetical protein [Halomarina rubra]
MGISYTTDDAGYDGGIRREVHMTGTFDSSYTSGGEGLTAADAGLDHLDAVIVADGATESGYVPSYDATNGTVKLFEENATAGPLAEVAGSTDVSTETVTLVVRGRS